MMKKLTLLAMLLFGSTSIASASTFHSARNTSSVRDHRDDQGYSARNTSSVRDHRDDQGYRNDRNDRDYRDEPSNESCNVSGFYLGPAGNVQLVQRGNRIYGTFAQGQGQMTGVIQNGTITYTWSGLGHHGRGFWYVAGDGRLVGTWGTNDSNSMGGDWNLTLA